MIAATGNIHEAGIRKAAILVASLDQAAADLLLAQLSPEWADRVREAVMAIDQIDAQQQQRVIDEFRRIGPMIPGECPPGIELDSLAAPTGQTSLSAPAQAELPAPPDDSPPFGFLHETEEEDLSQLLGGERPQTIALVLSHLPPQRAGEVLAHFAPPRQVEVVRRLADLENTDSETLRQIEQALETRLLRQFAVERSRAAGPEAVARILAACPSPVVGGILDNLAQYDPALAEQLGHVPMEFDDVEQLDDATLRAVFRAAGPEVALAALLGSPPPLVERVLGGMTAAKARSLRRKLDCPGPIRLSDVEEARQQIAALARQMSRGSRSKTALAA
jgi:flagellar motor switch protein FliG